MVALIAAGGVLFVALANVGARDGAVWARALLWLGLITIYLPVTGRLTSRQAGRSERVMLLALLAVALYLVKVIRSPLGLTFHDELLHLRTAEDVLRTGRLYNANPLLPVSPLYPGLECVTSAVAMITGLDVFSAGIVVVGVARLVLVLALFCFYEEISGSPRVAGLATALFCCEPSFVFFDAQFGYGSLALTFVMLLLFTLAWADGRDRPRRGMLGLVALLAAALVITHHATPYLIGAYLVLWGLVAPFCTVAGVAPAPGWASMGAAGASGVFQWLLHTWAGLRHRIAVRRVTVAGWAGLLILYLATGWMAFPARPAIPYLLDPVIDGFVALERVFTGSEQVRAFYSSGGQTSPALEALLGYASLAVILMTLPIGLYRIWRRERSEPAVVALGLAALLYPLSQAFRLTHWGMQLVVRLSPFLYVPVAYVVAVGWSGALPVRLGERARGAALALAASLLFSGGFVLGYPFWSYLPGPYLVSADMRSVEAEGLAGAAWAGTILGPGHRMSTDRINRLLMGSYGQQRLVTLDRDGVNTPILFLSREYGPEQEVVTVWGDIEYLTVDRRLAGGLPMVGTYYDDGEKGAYGLSALLDIEALDKFDRLPRFSRVYDSGNIVIYGTGRGDATIGTTVRQGESGPPRTDSDAQ